MSDQSFIRLRGRIQGPFTLDQLQTLAKRGQFSRAHEISIDGMSWTRATNRPELFASSHDGPAAVPAVPYADSLDMEQLTADSKPPQTDVWYYHQLGVKHGPIDFSHLQYLASSGQLLPADMVWKQGLPDWIAAARVPGLISSTSGSSPVQQSPMLMATMVPYPPPTEFPRVSALAVASLVLGILWLGGIGSILAIIFGAVSLYQIRVSQGRLTGRGLAVAGLVLGIAMMAVLVVVLVKDEVTRARLGL